MTQRKSVMKALAIAGVASLALAACSSSDSDTEASPTSNGNSSPSDGVLKIGTVLPQTGTLDYLGPPEFAGVELAVNEINEAGGVNGNDVEWFEGDSSDTSTNIASTTADQMIARGSDVIVGAASSSVSLTIIDKITSAGVLQYSPANTSPEFTNYEDNGLYFRTAPPDTFQGPVLAEVVSSENKTKPAVLVLQDSYGEGLATNFQSSFEASGGSLAAEPIYYDPKAATFSAEVGQAKSAKPDSIVLIGFLESSKIIDELIKQGIGPDKTSLFLVDGNLSNTNFSSLPAGVLEGTLGTLPGSESPKEFREALLEIDPKLKDFSYGPESYDAVITSALAAIAAGDDTGPAIAGELAGITADGEKCDTFASCKKLLEDGADIDYDGQSGPIEMLENGDPSEGTMGVYRYGSDNQYVSDRYIEGTVPSSS